MFVSFNLPSRFRENVDVWMQESLVYKLWLTGFLTDLIQFLYSCKDRLENILAKLFSILSIGFRGEDV